jgi:hypothetical protein
MQMTRAPDFAELSAVTDLLQKMEEAYLTLVLKNGGFAVKFTDKDGRLAKGDNVKVVVASCRACMLRAAAS